MQKLSEFHELWNSEYALDYEDFIENYQTNYNIIKEQRRIAKEAEIPSLEEYKLQPNSMQAGFITNLRKLYEAGKNCS